jgi:hypothetical protein
MVIIDSLFVDNFFSLLGVVRRTLSLFLPQP